MTQLYQRTKASTHYIIQLLHIILLCSLLTACFQKNLPLATDDSSIGWTKRKQSLESLSHWTLRGKAAFQSNKEAGSASFEWQQQQDRFSFAAFSPLGNEEFRLQGNQSLATLQLANGKHYDAANSDELLLRTLGFALPLSSLSYWIRGIPNPHLPAKTTFDASNRLSQLQQANWQVDFMSYTTISGIDLPRLISMRSSSYKTKVVVYQWQIQ